MDEFTPRPPEFTSTIEAVRKRPGMYLGNTAFFGFINYLVCPVALLLGQRPKRVAIAARDGGFEVESDVAVPIEETSNGRFAPFEEILKLGHGHSLEGTILTALSERMTVEVRHEHRTETLEFRRGTRESHRRATTMGYPDGPHTILKFVPDASIFTVTGISPAIFQSYLRRLSFLHQGVRFSLALGDESHEYVAKRGIADLFASVSAPYQILHEPIHILGEAGSLRLEAVFAYHSWEENGLWCFINKGRAVEGGTHETGFHDALDQLYREFKLPKSPNADRNGVVGIVSIEYPDTVWEGCIKARIGNPELRSMVCSLVVQCASDWLRNRPDVAEQIQNMETFQFPDAWYT